MADPGRNAANSLPTIDMLQDTTFDQVKAAETLGLRLVNLPGRADEPAVFAAVSERCGLTTLVQQLLADEASTASSRILVLQLQDGVKASQLERMLAAVPGLLQAFPLLHVACTDGSRGQVGMDACSQDFAARLVRIENAVACGEAMIEQKSAPRCFTSLRHLQLKIIAGDIDEWDPNLVGFPSDCELLLTRTALPAIESLQLEFEGDEWGRGYYPGEYAWLLHDDGNGDNGERQALDPDLFKYKPAEGLFDLPTLRRLEIRHGDAKYGDAPWSCWGCFNELSGLRELTWWGPLKVDIGGDLPDALPALQGLHTLCIDTRLQPSGMDQLKELQHLEVNKPCYAPKGGWVLKDMPSLKTAVFSNAGIEDWELRLVNVPSLTHLAFKFIRAEEQWERYEDMGEQYVPPASVVDAWWELVLEEAVSSAPSLQEVDCEMYSVCCSPDDWSDSPEAQQGLFLVDLRPRTVTRSETSSTGPETTWVATGSYAKGATGSTGGDRLEDNAPSEIEDGLRVEVGAGQRVGVTASELETLRVRFSRVPNTPEAAPKLAQP